MDPNENLKKQLEIADRITSAQHFERDAEDLASLVLDLHEWIANGGFLPAAWQKGTR